MPSPLPGMNPDLERDIAWHDFHERFLVLGAGAPQPPLEGDDAAWAARFVPKHP